VFWFSLQVLFEKISLSNKNSARYHNCTVHRFSYEYQLFMSDFKRNLNCFDRFSADLANVKFSWKSVQREIVPCGRTDTSKLMVAFRNFAKGIHQYLWLYEGIKCASFRSVVEVIWGEKVRIKPRKCVNHKPCTEDLSPQIKNKAFLSQRLLCGWEPAPGRRAVPEN
jgi:hypothetical protein